MSPPNPGFEEENKSGAVQPASRISSWGVSLAKRPRRPNRPPHLRGEMLTPHFFTFFFWGGFLFLVGGFLASRGKPNLYFGFMISGGTGIAVAYLYSLVCLYKCWAILQGFTARTTPGRAVGFLFIPVYNLYWLFVAISGLAKDANLFLARRKIKANRINTDLSLAVCILMFIPYVGPIKYIGLINMVLFNILVHQWARFYNSVIAHRTSLLQPPWETGAPDSRAANPSDPGESAR